MTGLTLDPTQTATVVIDLQKGIVDTAAMLAALEG